MWQIILVVLIVLLLWKIWKEQTNSLARLPGPTKYPIIGSSFNNNQTFDAIFELPKKYGNRVAIKTISGYSLYVYDPEDIEVVLTHSQNIKKMKAAHFLHPWIGTGILTSTGPKWEHRRKIMNPVLHFNQLKSFIPVFHEQSKVAVKQIAGMIEEGNNIIELWSFCSDAALSILCETVMGVKLGSEKTESKLKYLQAVTEIGQIVMERRSNVWLQFDCIFKLLPISRRFYDNIHNAHTFTNALIRERRDYYHNSNDLEATKTLLDLLFEAEKRGEIDLEGIREEVETIILTGHDTPATTLTFGLMLLADHEEVQDRIYDECMSVLGNSEHNPSMSELNDLKYLKAVIKEILRLYPSIPLVGRDIIEDFMLGDIKVKKNTQVLASLYNAQRRPDLFPDPYSFKPERFLDGRKKRPFAYLPFSAGARNCFGQKYGKLEIVCFIAEIIRNFKIKLVKKGNRPTFKKDIVMRPNEPIHVKFVPRK